MPQTCDVCGSTILSDEGPAGNGDCYSASGHETVCDDCMDNVLTDEEKAYIQGTGPRAGRWA